jgi:hypothetical protein
VVERCQYVLGELHIERKLAEFLVAECKAFPRQVLAQLHPGQRPGRRLVRILPNKSEDRSPDVFATDGLTGYPAEAGADPTPGCAYAAPVSECNEQATPDRERFVIIYRRFKAHFRTSSHDSTTVHRPTLLPKTVAKSSGERWGDSIQRGAVRRRTERHGCL